ncbi:hypothetical protein TorRG33x02_143100 [Trema orientale]|uniref:Uncharacterized protein n=1 Tax=Trema orientale TaxID=63057 RepID=A0A2P5EWV2_TREOI|nr:hypothetical protein TorRG33x02_143100 [Trema orientale]
MLEENPFNHCQNTGPSPSTGGATHHHSQHRHLHLHLHLLLPNTHVGLNAKYTPPLTTILQPLRTS